MKRIGVSFILIAIATFGVKGQEDSSRIKNRLPAYPASNDSLKLFRTDKSGLEQSELYLDYDINPQIDSKVFTHLPAKKRNGFINAPYTKFIIPVAMVSYGLIAQESDKLQELDKSTHHEITEHYDSKFRLDDYLQFTPYAAYYALDFCGIKAKHNFRDRTIVLASSYAIMSITVQSMKQGFKVERPDGSSKTSFPSGHTATAFLGAHLLFREYKDASPWIGVAGYLSAATVGALRVRNERHWVSDVVAGAGIGILSAEVGYMLLPVFHNILGIREKNKSLVVVPAIGYQNYGVGLAYTF